MKHKLLGALLAFSILTASPAAFAQAPAKSEAATEFAALHAKIMEKIKAGKTNEGEFADNLKEFDTLLAKHKAEKTDDVAQILYMESMLYMQAFKNNVKAAELIQQLKRDFPDTKPGQSADKLLAHIKKQEEDAKLHATMGPGTLFPDFNEKDLDGKPLSVANFKGKVVLVDFWATWCGPCVRELPNVQKIYEKQHAHGFEIIGVSLDSDKTKLTDFIKAKAMPWQQYFDGKGWENKLAQKYGVESIPATYLIDKEGKIIADGLRGDDLDAAVAKALGK